MKIKGIKKMLAGFMAAAICVGLCPSTAYAMDASGTTTLPNKMVEVTVGDRETIVNEAKSDMKGIAPVYDANKQELYLSNFTDVTKTSVTGPAPAGFPFQFVGYGDYSKQWVSKVYVSYEKDDDSGKTKKDQNGNYIIDNLHKKDGTILTTLGTPAKNINGTFDQKTGTRAQHFLLMNEDGDALYAYCVDLGITAYKNKWYAISNLEDNDYYASQDAEDHVRAIVLNGYWGTASGTGSLGKLKADLKAALADGAIPKEYEISFISSDKKSLETTKVILTDDIIDGLTSGEALDMTQAAIWTYSDGAQRVQDGEDGEFVGDLAYGDSINGNDEYKSNDPYGAARMKALYEMLINLETNAKSTTVINDKNFVDTLKLVVGDVVEGTEKVYNVDLRFTLAATPSSKDNLLLSIGIANETITRRLAGPDDSYERLTPDENGVYTISGLTLIEGETFEITMDVLGEQYLEHGVYIYVSKDGINSSQSMIGIAEGTNKVDVSMSTEVSFELRDFKERKINFYKTTTINEGRVPLQGIEFDIHKVCSLEEYTANNNKYVETRELSNGKKKDFVSSQVLNNLRDYPLVETVVTDTNGRAVYDLTADGQPDGIYLVIEKDHPAITAPLSPFYVTVPQTLDDGTDAKYVIDLEPKNSLLPGPQIDKDVTEIDQEEDTVNAGEEFTWIIRTTIPADIAKANEYVISDELDYRLTYADKMVVKVEDTEDKADNTVSSGDVLIKDEDYELNVTDGKVTLDDGKEEAIQKFTVTLTPDGLKKVAKFAGANRAGREIRVYFNTYIDEDASVGEEIENDAKLNYTNSVGMNYKVESDDPVVYTCGINIKKYDAKETTTFLEGAEFMVARKATDAEIADETIETENLVIARGQSEVVVFVDFYNNADLIGDKVDKIVTNETGDAFAYGLEEGTYYLVETKAPAGYNLLSYPVEIALNKISHAVENTVTVANSNSFVLPGTGGIGTTIFTLVGAALSLGSGAVLAGKKRKEETEE